jgi:FkbM family methyltransferase
MTEQFITPNGNSLVLATRGDTNDAALANAILSTDEYQLHGRHLSGWALDIGSHIGSVGLALAVDNIDLSVVCIEPVPDNCEVIRASIAANALGGRVFVEEGSAGAPGQTTLKCRYDFTDADTWDKGGIHDSRFVGNVYRESDNPVATEIDSPVVTLSGLADKYETATFAFCKIDCEGCEVHAFADGVALIDEIIGEFHDNLLPQLRTLIEPTHDIEVIEDRGGIGLFRAVRR